MTQLPHAQTETHEPGAGTDNLDPSRYEMQERFALILHGYNAVHYDLLDAPKVNKVRRTEEPDIYEAVIHGIISESTLTAALINEDGKLRLEPLDFRSSFCLPLLPVFSYDWDCQDAMVIRLMTCWLERTFLIHEPAILEAIRALPPSESATND